MIQKLGHIVTRNFQSRVGILAIDCYFPNKCVDQTDLEVYDDVGEGKYTIGLGQNYLSFVNDREDSISMMLTALNNLLEKHEIEQDEIGAMYVGTETSLDRSKSVKTNLMQLFNTEYFSNTAIEGTDNINACFGGTESIFNALYWIESHYLNDPENFNKYAIVVCGDSATYREVNARPTCGAGAVAMLIGPNAPLEFNIGKKFVHLDHVYDFYKPDPSCIFPTVDGHYSNECYLSALDRCYTKGNFDIKEVDYILFHTPYNKLVQKSIGYLSYLDYVNSNGSFKKEVLRKCVSSSISSSSTSTSSCGCRGRKIEEAVIFEEEVKNKILSIPREESYSDRFLLDTFKEYSRDLYEKKVHPGMFLPKNLGNSYTSSIHLSLCSLINEMEIDELENKNILMYSYGSGLVSAMYEIKVNDRNVEQTNSNGNVYSLNSIKESLSGVNGLIEDRIVYPPEEYDTIDRKNSENFTKGMKDIELVGNIDELKAGTFYLESVDEMFRREYLKKE